MLKRERIRFDLSFYASTTFGLIVSAMAVDLVSRRLKLNNGDIKQGLQKPC